MFFIFYLYTGFSIKNISVLNKHNFGPNRRTRIQEKEIWSTKVDLVNILTKFCTVIKIRGYVT